MKHNILKGSILIFILILLSLQIPDFSSGAPSKISEFHIKAKILNITTKNDHPYYEIEIIESQITGEGSDKKAKPGDIIKASKFTGRDCQVNDTIEARLTWQRDEFGEWYQLYDVKLAGENDHQMILILFLISIFITILVGAIILIYIIKKKGNVRAKKR